MVPSGSQCGHHYRVLRHFQRWGMLGRLLKFQCVDITLFDLMYL